VHVGPGFNLHDYVAQYVVELLCMKSRE
jgi:hypothetical protein